MIFREKDFAEGRSLSLSEIAVELRAFCPTGDGGGVDNSCSAEGSTSSSSSAGRSGRDNSWKSQESGTAQWTGDQMLSKSGKSPIRLENADTLERLTIDGSPKKVSDALDSMGIDLDAAVSLGGGIIRDAAIVVYTMGGSPQGIGVQSDAPVQPGDTESRLRVGWSVFLSATGSKKQIELEGFYLPEKYTASDPDVSPEDRRRITSLMMGGVISSLTAAEKNNFDVATTFAVGDKDGDMKGYRLWPKFGFDGPIGKTFHDSLADFATRAVRGEDTPDWAADLIDAIDEADSKGTTVSVQDVIASREGQKWWDQNGRDIDLTLNFKNKSSPGYKRFKEMQKKMEALRGRNQERSALSPLDLLDIFDWADEDGDGHTDVEYRSDDCGRVDDGKFAPKNDCAAEDGPVEKEVKASKQRNVDVLIGGVKHTAVLDAEAKQRAVEDFRSNPKPEGSAAGSTTDLWGREFAFREAGSNKIARHSPVFPPETHANMGQYVSHDAVGQYLSNRHEEQRRQIGAKGPAAIIDTTRDEIPAQQMQYVVDSLAEDAIHAYEVLQVDPGFYGTDIEKTMATMSRRHPELASDENAKFIFTMLTAITSSGQGPDANLADADGLYAMWKKDGTLIPSSYGGGARDVTKSLKVLQGLVDSFGLDRTRRLLSGYTTAGSVNKTFKSLVAKSGNKEWSDRTGSQTWELPTSPSVKGELVEEVVPVAAIFGPKIGSFFANLSGRHDFLTMDRWLMRSVGRVTGELITRSTPEQAYKKAQASLLAIESGKWSRDYLFGVDKKFGITKQSLVRSLKIQAKTGVIEEHGPAFIWARAAERSHSKVPNASGGGYGKHEDPRLHALHQAGNALFKSLIHEQQDPRSPRARQNIREVFRRIQDRVEQQSGRRPPVDEIQAALWQYEKRLWRHLGAKGKVEENSLFSSAAEGIQSGRIKARTFRPASRRAEEPLQEVVDGEDFDTFQFDVEQEAWMSDLEESGIDVIELLALLEDDVEERRNFAPLHESRNDCGRQSGGRFGPGNDCASDEGGGGVAVAADDSWLDDSGSVTIDESDVFRTSPPFTGAETLREFHVENVPALKGAMQGFDGIKSIDDVIAIGGGTRKGASIQIGAYWREGEGDIRVSTSLPVSPDGSASRGYVRSLVSLYKDDVGVVTVEYDNLVPDEKADEYLDAYREDGPDQYTADRRRVSSILLERMTESLTAAEGIGAARAHTYAAGNAKSIMQGYRLWPQFGFDADLSPHMQRSIQDDADDGMLSLTRDQREDLASGLLTIQGLISTRDGERWWNEKGNSSNMTLDFSNKSSLGYERFEEMKKKLARLKRRNEGRDWTFPADAELRYDCGRVEGGKFGPKNQCQDDGNAGGATATETGRRDDSWMTATNPTTGRQPVAAVWSGDTLRESPPVTGGETMKKIGIGGGIDRVVETMRATPGVSSLDDVAAIAGGVRKGGELTVTPGYGNSLEVKARLPIDIENENPQHRVDTHVTIYPAVFGSPARIDYQTFVPVGTGTKTLSGAVANRVTSVMMQKMIESLEVAERGQMIAETFGAGDKTEQTLDGYRLWMRFGFDAKFGETKVRRITEAASSGSLTLTSDQQQSISEGRFTLQELISTSAGERWWVQNGTGITMTIDFRDKQSPGYRRFQEMKKLLPTLRKRNEGRSLDDWMWGVESREDCGRDESGRFGPKNQCQEDGEDDLSGIKDIRPRSERELVDAASLPRRQQESAERIRQMGVSLQFESADISDGAFELVEQGIAMLAESGLDWPREIRIGENGAAAASVHPDTGVTIVSKTMTAQRARDAINSGWFSGDAELPLASILVHEQTHTDHYASLLPFGDDVWDKITGRYDMDRLKSEAESAGRPFRPAAGTLEEYAWSPAHRPKGASKISSADAIRIASTVSGYAKTNPPEFVCEFRAGVLSGREYSDEAWALYEAYAGPKLLRRSKK